MNNNNNNSNDNTSSNLLQHTNNPFSNLLSSNASTGGGSVGGGSVGVGGVGVGGGIGLGIGIGIGIGIGGLGGNNNNVGGSIIGGVGGVGSIIGGAPGPGTGQASGQGQVQNQGQGQVQQGPSSINMPSMASMSTITAGSNSINNNANLFGLNNLGGGVSGGVGGGIGLSGGGIGVGVGGPAPSSGSNMVGGGNGGVEELLPLVIHLTNPEQREGVLLELSKKRESFPDLAPILWHTYGTVAALLQEIVSIYPLLSPPTLTAHASNRVCNALALLQCVASHPDTRSLFLSAHVPLYLYPFLNTQSKSRPFEYLRLTSLGVVGALVKMDDPDVINFLLQTEIIPLCLRIMETGSELSKTVATFIVQKILLDEIGLSYVCATAERFYAVSTVLNNMIGILVLTPSVRLLKHIVRCYLRLSDNVRAREALRQCLPMSLRDETFGNALRDDVTVKKWLSQLLSAVGPPMNNPGTGGGMMDASNGPGGLGAGVSGGLGGGLGGAPGTGNLDLGSS